MSTGGLAAGVTAITFLILTGAMQGPFQKAIDRRFYREKYKFDEAMGKMRLAVGSLVDRATLGRRLLEAASENPCTSTGSARSYLAEPEGARLPRRSRLPPAPSPIGEPRLPSDNPLVARLGRSSSIRVPHAMALAGACEPATDAMIAVGERGRHCAARVGGGARRSGRARAEAERPAVRG